MFFRMSVAFRRYVNPDKLTGYLVTDKISEDLRNLEILHTIENCIKSS